MANEMKNDMANFTPKGVGRGERKALPTWEFFYTGTLWRLTGGLKGRDVNPVETKAPFTLELH